MFYLLNKLNFLFQLENLEIEIYEKKANAMSKLMQEAHRRNREKCLLLPELKKEEPILPELNSEKNIFTQYNVSFTKLNQININVSKNNKLTTI
jgi:hypothetical protein